MVAVTGPKAVVWWATAPRANRLSRKDIELLTRAPHLVLDGLAAAAAAIAADEVYLYLHADALPTVTAALASAAVPVWIRIR